MRYEIYPSIILLLYTLGDDCHYNSKSEYIMHVGDMDIGYILAWSKYLQTTRLTTTTTRHTHIYYYPITMNYNSEVISYSLH